MFVKSVNLVYTTVSPGLSKILTGCGEEIRMVVEVFCQMRHYELQKEHAVADKKNSPKANLVMTIAGWLGTAISVYRIYTQSQKPDGDLGDAILNTVIFALIAVFATIQYRKSKQDH